MNYLKEKNYRVLVIIVTIIAIIFSGLTIFSYFQSAKLLREEINHKTKTKIEFFQERVQTFFEKREWILTSEALFVIEALSQREFDSDISKHLKNQYSYLNQEYGIVDLYVGYPDGRLDSGLHINLPKTDWKAYERPWFIKSMQEKDKIVYTNVYRDIHTGTLVLTMSKYITDGEKEAVIAIDLGLMKLVKLLETEKFGEGGYAFIIDKNGKFIIHPQFSFEEESEKENTIYNIADGEFTKTGTTLLNNQMELILAAYQGTEKAYMSKQIGNTEFYLITGLIQKEMRTQLNVIFVYNILILSIVLLGYVLFIMWLRWTIQNEELKKEIMKKD